MNERSGGRVFSNNSYDNRYVPLPSTPNPAFMSNSVPFHAMPFQNQYYPPQPVNIPLEVHYSTPEKATMLQNSIIHNSYYPNIPQYANGRSERPSPTSNPLYSNMYHQPLNVSSEQYGYSYDSTSSCNDFSSQPSNQSNKLQVSAKTFVPQNAPVPEQVCIKDQAKGEDIGAHQTVEKNINLESSNVPAKSYNDAKTFDSKQGASQFNNERHNYHSTRPKEFNKGRGNSNRKNWTANRSSQNWQNWEKSYNQGFNNYNLRMPSPRQEACPPFKNDNVENSRRYQNSKPKSQNRGSEQFHDFNGFNNNKNRRNPGAQIKQNFGPKKNEWKRSNEQSYYDYNYYDESTGRYPQQHNTKTRGMRYKHNFYPNESMKENFEYSSLREKGHKERFVKDWNFQSGPKPSNYLHSRNNGRSSLEFHRKNNFGNSYNEPKGASRGVPVENTFNYANEEEDETYSKEAKGEYPIGGQDNEKLQRENLVDNLTKGTYECMVCCERIKQQQALWSCSKCFNCFHLGCIKKWAGTSQGEPGWRCPACQNLNSKVPSGYFCFCKKLREPEWNRREIPHSCGEMCGKKREHEWCTHKCTILCHPGPCPDCNAFIKRQCQCGKNSKEMRCSMTEPYLCEENCDRSLNCGVHVCQRKCHFEACEKCSVIIDEICFCGKEKRSVECTPDTAEGRQFSCNSVCSKILSCGNHNCDKICHEGPCGSCSRAVEDVTTCPCGKVKLSQYYNENGQEERKSCEDPIPTCGTICGKTLKCGVPGYYHSCQNKCHEGPCPPCKEQTPVKCRCGFMDKKIPCASLESKADEVTCEKQCKKLRQCGRHKCGMKCCIDIDHVCTRVCGRTLTCRLHKCQEPCHRGNCPRCWETSFEELSCHCGASVLYPPVPCGTEPPPCELPCRRKQACSHPVSHNCHSDPNCSPCTTLVSKLCFGKHTTMKSTPCYVKAMSCGELCDKGLPCGKHTCQKVCHDGPCITGSSCNQKCTKLRPSCEHLCGNPCHSGLCPDTPCKELVTVSCVCGNRKAEMVCSDNEREYKSMATSKLASELHSLNSGGSVDISQIFTGTSKPEKLRRLDCNDDCALIARNRQLALALQITNPESRESLGEGGTNLYSDSLKEEARKDMQFAQMIHTTLNDLVLRAKQSKQKSRSHSFAPMNRDKRRFIHEYSKHFGCQSHSYDEEPKKNVVVTACKAMSRLPPISVVNLIQKELGQRKAPGPVLSRKTLTNEDTNSNQMKKLAKNGSFETKELSTSPKETAVIDYFDMS